MKKFQFRFQKVLDYKQTVEDLKRSNYSLEVNALSKEKDKLDYFIHGKKVISNQRNNSTVQTTVKDLKLFNNYLNHMNEIICEQNDIVNTKKADVEFARKELIKSVKEKKTFEKLKDKDYDNHLFELKKEEEKMVDQIVSFNNSTR